MCEIKSKKQSCRAPSVSEILSLTCYLSFPITRNREARVHTVCVGAKISLTSRHPCQACHSLKKFHHEHFSLVAKALHECLAVIVFSLIKVLEVSILLI